LGEEAVKWKADWLTWGL